MADQAPRCAVVIPTYNGATLTGACLDSLLASPPTSCRWTIVVVDDGSTDGTGELLAGGAWPENLSVLTHPANRGKGAAIATGLERASGRWSVIMDADLEYQPRDLDALIAPLASGEAEAVFGARGFQAHSAHSFWYVVGNKGVTFAANLLYNSWLSDIMTCHKAMSTELFRSLGLREKGFGIEPEIAARLLRRGVRIYEVPVVYRARSREQGKKLTVTDGFRVLRTLVRCRLTPA
jgi:glycosyltransferase involved in cell wall biosynthesis